MDLYKIVRENMINYKKKNSTYQEVLSDDFIVAISNLNISHLDIANDFSCSRQKVVYWRKKLIPNDIYKSNFKTKRDFTPREMLVIKNIELSDIEVCKILNRSRISVHLARKRYLSEEEKYESKFYRRRANKVENTSDIQFNRSKRLTVSEIRMIKERKYNDNELSVILGRSTNAITHARYRYKNVDI